MAQEALLEAAAARKRSRKEALNGGQDVVNTALQRLDSRIPRVWAALRKEISQNWTLRPRMLWLHRDWYTNYRPSSQRELKRWRVVHWQSTSKPWSGSLNCTAASNTFGSCDTKVALDRLLPELRDRWQAECRHLTRHPCVRVASWTQKRWSDRTSVTSCSAVSGTF